MPLLNILMSTRLFGLTGWHLGKLLYCRELQEILSTIIVLCGSILGTHNQDQICLKLAFAISKTQVIDND